MQRDPIREWEHESVRMTIRLPRVVWDDLAAEAKTSGVTLPELVAFVLFDWHLEPDEERARLPKPDDANTVRDLTRRVAAAELDLSRQLTLPGERAQEGAL